MTEAARGSLALGAALVLGVALINWSSQVLQVVLLVPVIAIVAMASLGRGGRPRLDDEKLIDTVSTWAVAAAAVVFCVSYVTLVGPSSTSEWILSLVVFAPLVALAGLIALDRGGRGAWIAFLGWLSIVVIIVLAATAGPIAIDVQLFQRESVAALIGGTNPYSITFVDPYSMADSARFYGAGVSVDGVLQFGYPYYPLSLLLVSPFEILFSDFRIAHGAAFMLSGILMSRLSPGTHATKAAVVFLLAAPLLMVVRFGWIDPLVILAAVGVVFLTRRKIRGPSLAMGLVLAMKQTSVFLVVPSLLVLPRPWTLRVVGRHFAQAAIVFAVVTVPFFLWDPAGFIRSVVTLQFKQPFRVDSIAFPALVPDWFDSLPSWAAIGLPFALVGLVTLVVVIRSPTGAQGFALGSALVLLVAYAFSKQAFANYYVVVVGLLCAGAAAAEVGKEDSPTETTATPGGVRHDRVEVDVADSGRSDR